MKAKQFFNYLAATVIASTMFACGSSQQHREKLMQQGKQLFQTGDYKQAQLIFEQALNNDPEDSDSRYHLAESLSKQGEVKKAFETYQAVLKKHEGHIMSRVRVAQLLLLNGQLADAENILSQLKAQHPDHIEVLVLQAHLNVLKNNTDAAIVSIEKALQLEPDSTSALMMQASIYHKTAKTDKAIELLQQSVARLAGQDAMHLMLANLLMQQQDKVGAEQQLLKILSLKQADFSAYQRLALFYQSDKQLDKAEQILREAVEKSSDSLQAKLYLIDFLAETRNADVAMAELLPYIAQQDRDYELQFKLAALQLNKGQAEQAEDTLNSIVEQDKQGEAGLKARNTLAAVYLNSQRLQLAKQRVEEVLAVQPENHDALLLQGRFDLAEGKIDQAISNFRQLLQNNSEDVQVMKLLASAHVMNNDAVLAAENMQKVVALNAQDIVARQDLVELLIKTDQHSVAEQHLAVLLKQDAGNKKALEALFKIRIQQKNWPAAQQITELFLQDENFKSQAHYMSGLAFQAEGKLEDSIEAFKNALTLKPDAIEPLTQLLNSYMALDQSKHAVSYINSLLKKDKDHFIAYKLLGDLYMQQKNWSQADKAYSQAIRIKPEWADIYRELAKIALIENNQDSAIKVLQKGIEHSQGSIALYNDLATIYHNQGDQTEALAWYEKAYQKQPTSALAINNLAAYLVHIDESPKTLARAAKLAEPLEQTANAQLLDTVAWIAFKQGLYNKAQSILEKISEGNGATPLIHYHLGMVYFKQGDKLQAKNYLGKALSASSDFEGVEEIKQVLNSIKES